MWRRVFVLVATPRYLACSAARTRRCPQPGEQIGACWLGGPGSLERGDAASFGLPPGVNSRFWHIVTRALMRFITLAFELAPDVAF